MYLNAAVINDYCLLDDRCLSVPCDDDLDLVATVA